MKTQSQLIGDDESLVGVLNRHGSPVKFYDDGYGPMFILRDSMGLTAV